jgi:hypothetical protein
MTRFAHRQLAVMVAAARSNAFNQTSTEYIMRKSSLIAIAILALAASVTTLPARAEGNPLFAAFHSSGSGKGKEAPPHSVVIAIIAVLIG